MIKVEKYHIFSRVIHWLMAIIIIGQLSGGIYMSQFLLKTSEYRSDFYNLHKSFGALVLLLILVRIINKIINKSPSLPDTITKSEKILANIAHYSLYLLMILVPLSGYLMSNSYGYSVKFFSITLPNLVEKNYEIGALFSSTHKYLGYLTVIIVVLHIAGALKHRYFDKNKQNDVLKRML